MASYCCCYCARVCVCVSACLSVCREKEKAAQREMQVGTLLAAKDRKVEDLKEVCTGNRTSESCALTSKLQCVRVLDQHVLCLCLCVIAHVSVRMCVCVQVLSSKESALCKVTEQWQTSQLSLGEREKELSQVSGQPVILYQVPHVHLWWSMSSECRVFDASL